MVLNMVKQGEVEPQVGMKIYGVEYKQGEVEQQVGMKIYGVKHGVNMVLNFLT